MNADAVSGTGGTKTAGYKNHFSRSSWFRRDSLGCESTRAAQHWSVRQRLKLQTEPQAPRSFSVGIFYRVPEGTPVVLS